MSADNGIYIAEFDDGKFRVIEATAIDNVDSRWYSNENEYYEVVRDYFKNSPEFNTVDESYAYARKLEDDFYKNGWFLEYGICRLREIYPKKW